MDKNIFDQFDEPETGNVFDQFDDVAPSRVKGWQKPKNDKFRLAPEEIGPNGEEWYSADNPPYDANAFVAERKKVGGKDYFRHSETGEIYDATTNRITGDPAILQAFGKTKPTQVAQRRLDAKAQGAAAPGVAETLGRGIADRAVGLLGGFLQSQYATGQRPNMAEFAASVPWLNMTPEMVADMQAKADAVDAQLKAASRDVMTGSKQAQEGIGYEPITGWEDVKDPFMKGDYLESAKAVPGFALEQFITSLPNMAAAWLTPWLALPGETGRIAQERAQNDQRDYVTNKDLAISAPVGAAITVGERIGLGKIINPGRGVTAPIKAGLTEGATEFVQEGAEDIASTIDTQKGWNPAQSLEMGIAGAVGGAPAGTIAAIPGAIMDSRAPVEAPTPAPGKTDRVEPNVFDQFDAPAAAPATGRQPPRPGTAPMAPARPGTPVTLTETGMDFASANVFDQFDAEPPAPGAAPMAPPRNELAAMAQAPMPEPGQAAESGGEISLGDAGTVGNQEVNVPRAPAENSAPPAPDRFQPTPEQSAQLDKILSGNKAVTTEALAPLVGGDVKVAGQLIQKAIQERRLIQTRGKWMTRGDGTQYYKEGRLIRPPKRVKPVSALEAIAAAGGISDPTGELKGMDAHRKMTPYGPLVRPTGMHPDKARELLLQDGYLLDPGWNTGAQQQTTVADVYNLISTEMAGQKVYRQEDLAQAEAIETERKNALADPEARVAPSQARDMLEKNYGPDIRSDVIAAAEAMDIAISKAELDAAAQYMMDGMSAEDAVERAVISAADALYEMGAEWPEIAAMSASWRDVRGEDIPFDAPASPVAQEPAIQAQEEPTDEITGTVEGDGRPSTPDGEEGQRPGPEEEVSPVSEQGDGTGETVSEDIEGLIADARDRATGLTDPYDWVDAYSADPYQAMDRLDGALQATREAERAILRKYKTAKAYDLDEDALTPTERDFLFYSTDSIDSDLRGQLQRVTEPVINMDEATTEMSYAVRKMKPKDQAGTEEPFILARMNYLYGEIERLGGNPMETLKAAVSEYASRIEDPQDREFLARNILERVRERMDVPAADVPALPAPATEQGPDGASQLVIPGAEKIPDKAQAEREAKKPLKAKAPQKDADEGLFGEGAKSPELFDAPASDIPGDQRSGEKSLTQADGLQIGDRVDVPSRTIGPSTIEGIFERPSLSSDGKPAIMLRIRNDAGKGLVIVRSEAKKIDSVAAPKKPEPKAEKPAKAPAPAEKWNKIGVNRKGFPVYEDERGVRSYVESGVRISETVEIIPGGGIRKPAERGSDYTPVEDWAAEGQKAFAAGKPNRVPAGIAGDPKAAKAWQDGWTRANVAQPVGDMADAVKFPSYGSNNTLVTKSRAEEIRAKLQAKLKGQLNAGIDPEILALGAELAAFHIEAGARKFTDFAKAVAADLGASIKDLRPYLRSWYNGARDMMEDAGLGIEGMDGPDEVRAALAELDKEQTTDDAEPDIRSPVGEEGVRETGSRVAEGKPVGKSPDRTLEDEPAKDGTGSEGGKRPRSPSTRPAKSDVGRDPGQPEGRPTPDRRPRTSGEGLAVEGAGDGGRPDEPAPPATRPNYYIADPEQLIGGTPKVRFARNRKAIETFRTLQDEQRDPTPAELDDLAGYIGWGSFGQELFQGNWQRPMPKDGWQNEDKWLREHLGQEEWESAQRSIINAHYTDPPTVMTMWDMVQRMGFTGGRILEPSMGIGNFFGMMPRDIMAKSDLTGIELDRLTGGMAKLLYPAANVQIKGYEASKTGDNFYDLVIGNWPFAADGPADRRYDKLNLSLHDYFFVKALDQVRPGGLVVGITSSGTMDKVGRAARSEMFRKADLVASYRLPSGAFEKYAGTSVVTDIIILQKRDQKAERGDAKWLDAKEIDVPGGTIRVNEYYLNNPKNVLGKLGFGHGTTFGRAGMIVEREPGFFDALNGLRLRVPEGIYQPVKRGKEPRFITNNTKDREGSIIDQDGNLFVVQGERLARLEDMTRAFQVKDKAKADTRRDQVRQLIGLRRAYGALIDAERDGAADVETKRTDLRTRYEKFKKKHGTIGESDGIKVFRDIEDPFTGAIAALETEKGRPSRILSESTIRQKKKIDKPSVSDAFVIARNEAASLDINRVAELAGKSVAEVERELLKTKAVYRTPGGGYEVSDVFLSGNVRRKLKELEEAKARGEDVDDSLEAIKKVIPKDTPYFQIEAKMGATWVPNEYYQQYIADLLGVTGPLAAGIEVRFRAGSWVVRFKAGNLNDRPEATTTWGHPQYPFHKLLRAAMNNQTITIRNKDMDGNLVVDEGATKEANAKAARVREEFSAWAWRETDRKITLERQYNEIMNAIATPKYDGSFLDFSGMALQRGDHSFNLRQHQVNAIWRGIANRRGLYAHEVGTGKTYTMGGIAVESRRYGLARKPLLIAHNANSATVAKEVQEMYPGAAVLYIPSMAPDQVETTMRRIANEDWDLIVIPHSLIDRMALSEDTLMEIAKEDIQALEDEAIEAAKEDNVDLKYEDMDDEDKMKKVRSTTAKNLVHQRNRIIKSIKDMANRASRDNAVFFEEMGIDTIIVDEAHEFKKPPLATRMKMRGLNLGTSNRSIALRFLTDYVKRQNGGHGVHVFTGTPITNTLTEIYNMMRFVMDDQMKLDGIKDWDAWFNTFADASTDVELTATGEYEPVTRLASFVNVAELRRMSGQYMDIVFADDMPEFQPRAAATGRTMSAPDLTEGEREQLLNGRTENPVGRPYKKIVSDVGPMGPQQEAILNRLVELAKKFRRASGKDRRDMLMRGDEATPIRVETAAANAGLDPRLADMNAEDIPSSKVNRAVTNLMRHFREHPQATQVVFVERGFNSSATQSMGKDEAGKKITRKVERFNLVDDLIKKLTDQGIPQSQIAVVDGSTSKEKRKELADAMNRAEIRVIIGSSATLGVGVNMQANLRAMHHLDAPWMPGLLEQRNGRGWRQGNKWNTVLEYRYITEKLDGRRWQVLAVKDRFIKAFLTADENTRIIEGDAVSTDEGESANDLAQTLSEAAGDPRILLLNKYSADVNRLEQRERLHSYGIVDAKDKIKELNAKINRNKERASIFEQDAKHLEDQGEVEFKAYIGGIEYDKRADANEAFEKTIKDLAVGSKMQPIGSYRGFLINARKMFADVVPDIVMERKGTYHIKPSFASADAILRGLRKNADDLKDVAEIEASIKRLDDMTKQGFPQQKTLDAKKKLLADIRLDLEMNPVAPPAWLRHGAPTDTLIYVDGKSREVQGHKWTDEGYFIVTAEGLVPYMDARTENGDFVFEERDFVAPVIKKDEKQPPAAPQVQGNVQGRASTEFVVSRAQLKTLNVKAQALARRILGHGVRTEVVENMPSYVPADFIAAYDASQRAVWLSLHAASNMAFNIGHESMHDLRRAGAITDAEWKVLTKAARERGGLDPTRIDIYRREYMGRYGMSERQFMDRMEEEAVADMLGDYVNGWEASGPVARILARIKEFIEALQSLLRGEGFTTATGILSAANRGELARRIDEPMAAPDAEMVAGNARTITAKNMLELKAKIYKAEGWTRKAGESGGARIKQLYDVEFDQKNDRVVATRKPISGNADPEILGMAPPDDGGRGITGTRMPNPMELAGPEADTAGLDGIVGNLNLTKIKASTDIKAMLKQVSDEADGFMGARRGVVSQEQTRQLAAELGMSAADLLKRKEGQAFNAHELFAARVMLLKSAEAVKKSAAKASTSGSDIDRAEFMRIFTRHAAIQEQVAGMTAEAGRALNQFKMLAGADFLKGMKDLLSEKSHKGKFGTEAVDDLAAMVNSLSDSAGIGKFARAAFKPTFLDMIREYWINSLLSGYTTQTVNAVSNLLVAIGQVPETWIAEQLGVFRDGNRVQSGEAMARAFGLMAGARDGLQMAWLTLKAGEPQSPESKFDQPFQKAIPGVIGTIVRVPTRLMMTADEFFKSINYRADLYAQALRKAKEEGLSGDAMHERMADLIEHPSLAMMRQARDFAKYQTFQSKLGPKGQALMKTRESWHLWPILPFLRTPINILKFAAERSPLMFLVKDARDNLMGRNGAAARDMQLSRVALGSMLAAGAVSMAMSGMLTGGGPDDEREKAILRAGGWQPYSIKINGVYYNYLRFDPFSLQIGIAADMVEAADKLSAAEYEEMGWMLAASIINNITDKTWMTGVTRFNEAVQNPQQFFESYIQNLGASFIPNILAQSARVMDPAYRDARSMMDKIKARIPGMRETLATRRNVFGEPIIGEGAAGPDILSPVYFATERNQDLISAFKDAEYYPSMPKREINGHELTPEQYERYSELAGETALKDMRRVIARPSWKRFDIDKRADLLKRVFDDARKDAREAMKRQFPDLRKKVAE